MADGNEMKTAIKDYLSSKNVSPTPAWLQAFMPSIRPNSPVVALQKTALFRILSADLTKSIQASSSAVFPAGVSEPSVTESKLPGPITVQVLDVEDIGRSRWSQVEDLEARDRGETTKGQEVIRVVPEEGSDRNNTAAASQTLRSFGPHKLLLQDAKATKVYGVELSAVNGVGVHMSIGTKLVLRNIVVARGVVLLEPKGVEMLGGKVEVWDKEWRSERKDVLKRKAGMSTTDGG